MAKQLMTISALLVLGVALSVAAPKSSGSISSAFDEWLNTFDPSTAVESKISSCLGLPNGFYPLYLPETDCYAVYTACVNGIAYQQACPPNEAFDSTPGVEKCVNRFLAQSAVCYWTYGEPSCDAANLGEYEPTERCSDIYYVCLPPVGSAPQFQKCSPGLPTHYFDQFSFSCQPTEGAELCQAPVVPPTATTTANPLPPVVPPYGCGSDKTTGLAYAITECSASFYTCDRSVSSSPLPASCNTYGTGLVFDYRANPAPPSSTSCIPKTQVAECPP